jgi:hypothetical protein
MTRISPYWIHPRFDLLRVTSRHQFDLYVRDLVQFVHTNSIHGHCCLLTLLPQQVRLLGVSIDYFLRLDRLLQQLIRLLSTSSTTRTNYFNNLYDYFNYLYDYFLCDHDKASPILGQVSFVSCQVLHPG